MESQFKTAADLEKKKAELQTKIKSHIGCLQAAKKKASQFQEEFEVAKERLDRVQTEVDGLTRRMKEEAEDPKAHLKIDLSKLKKVETTQWRNVSKAILSVKKHQTKIDVER